MGDRPAIISPDLARIAFIPETGFAIVVPMRAKGSFPVSRLLKAHSRILSVIPFRGLRKSGGGWPYFL
jgi:hypothetical protein